MGKEVGDGGKWSSLIERDELRREMPGSGEERCAPPLSVALEVVVERLRYRVRNIDAFGVSRSSSSSAGGDEVVWG